MWVWETAENTLNVKLPWKLCIMHKREFVSGMAKCPLPPIYSVAAWWACSWRITVVPPLSFISRLLTIISIIKVQQHEYWYLLNTVTKFLIAQQRGYVGQYHVTFQVSTSCHRTKACTSHFTINSVRQTSQHGITNVGYYTLRSV